jgi:hypothetical protein
MASHTPDIDPRRAAAVAAWSMDLAIRATRTSGGTVPEWAATVAELLRHWSQQLGPGGAAAGLAGQARTPGVLDTSARLGVLAGGCGPAAPLSTHPLLIWLRLRFGIRRCLACGRLGQGSLQPASLLVPPQLARTWWCVDRQACRARRLRRSGSR